MPFLETSDEELDELNERLRRLKMAGMEKQLTDACQQTIPVELDLLTFSKTPIVPSTPFCIDFKGFIAEGNLAYVEFLSPHNWEAYAYAIDKIKAEVENKVATPLTMFRMSPGMNVIGKVESEDFQNVKYIRCMILELKADSALVLDMDELKEYELSDGNVYSISEEALAMPFRATKVELEYLELFSGSKYVAAVFNCMPELVERKIYCAEVCKRVSKNLLLPVKIRILTPLKENLGEIVLRNMWRVCGVPLEQEGDDDIEVAVTHYTDVGEIWYQAPTLNAKLLDIINSFDRVIKYELIIVKNRDRNYSSIDVVKERLNYSCEIFAALYSQDNMFYRAQVLKVLDDKNVHVRFIDYGNDEEIAIEKLVILDDFDNTIQFIPPQSRMIRLRVNTEIDCARMDEILEENGKFKLGNITNGGGHTYGDILVEPKDKGGVWKSIVELLE